MEASIHDSWMTSSIVLFGSYLLGSVLFGVIVSRVVRGWDPRESGSGNPGATNVMRVAGKGAGATALLLDVVKGTAAVLLARELSPVGSFLPAAAAAVVVLGHLFPVFFGFRGGKGVATALGAFLVSDPQASPRRAGAIRSRSGRISFRLASIGDGDLLGRSFVFSVGRASECHHRRCDRFSAHRGAPPWEPLAALPRSRAPPSKVEALAGESWYNKRCCSLRQRALGRVHSTPDVRADIPRRR